MSTQPVVYGEIYKHTCLVDEGRCYIGQTVVGASNRWIGHVRDANKGSTTRFSKALRQFGHESFRMEILATGSDKKHLDSLEKRYIAAHKCDDPKFGYNIEPGGSGKGFLPHSVKIKIGEQNKGRKQSVHSRAKRSVSRTGKTLKNATALMEAKDRLIAAYSDFAFDQGNVNRSRQHETRFYKQVVNYCKVRLLHWMEVFPELNIKDAAEDWTQDVVVRVIERVAQFEAVKEFYHWIYRSMDKQWIPELLNTLVEEKEDSIPMTAVAVNRLGLKTGEIDNPALYRLSQPRTVVDDVLRVIEGTDLMICKLILEGWNYARIASELDLTEGAVKKRLQKLRDRMKKEKAHNKR